MAVCAHAFPNTLHLIDVDTLWIDNFNNSNTRLCMAKATRDASGKEIYNLVMMTRKDISKTVTIEWTDEYAIEASTIAFNRGAKVTSSALRKDIAFGERYELKS